MESFAAVSTARKEPMILYILILAWFGAQVALAAPGGARIISVVLNATTFVLLLLLGRNVRDENK